MKVYVDKLPNSCFDCPCCSNSIECGCNLSDGSEDFFKFDEDENCPLKLIEDYKKEKDYEK